MRGDNTAIRFGAAAVIRRSICGALLALVAALAPSPASAAIAGTVQVEGVAQSAGGPVADGNYVATFRLHDSAQGGAELWSEGATNLAIGGGRFAVVLGATKPITPTVLGGNDVWLGVQFGTDPELPRRRLHAVPMAHLAAGLSCSGCVAAGSVAFNYAGSASKGGAAVDLSCTGCVSVAEMKFDGDVDLGGASLKAGSGIFSGDVVAKSVTAIAFVGDGSKLSGIKTPAGSCSKAGEVVKGIANDGGLICVKAMDPAALPPDGLDEISGGLLGTQFKDAFHGAKLPLAIPDNTGEAAVAVVEIGDLGTIEGVRVEVTLQNTDLSAVQIVLLPPDDKQTGFLLCDPCGNKDAKTLKVSYPDGAKPQKGDLATLIGKSPKGSWTLKVLDSAFCLPQAPGNAALCDTNSKTDGVIAAFAVEVATLSKTKVGAFAPLQLFRSKDAPYACDAVVEGSVFYDSASKRLRFCDGVTWRSLADACGNGVLEPSEECDDGNNAPGDGCSEICLASPGFAPSKGALSCSAILAAQKGAGGTAKSGAYWLDPDGDGGAPAFEVYCDMETQGGGWTLLFNLDSGDGVRHTYDDTNFWHGTGTEGGAKAALATGSKFKSYGSIGGKEVLVLAHDGGKEIGYAHYDLLANFHNKTMAALMAGGEATISGARKAQSGSVGATLNTKRSQSRFGDPFVDPKNGEALVVNKQSGWGAASNKNRLMTTANNGEYGHTISGLGGSHVHSGWGHNYESAPIASYCDCTNLYGNAANMEGNGQSTTLANNGGCYDPQLFKFLPVDTAVFVR